MANQGGTARSLALANQILLSGWLGRGFFIGENMKETEVFTSNDGLVRSELEAILSLWSRVPKEELPELFRGISVPVIELARRAGVSPQQALKEMPFRVELNGQDFRVIRSSKNDHSETGESDKKSSPNLRIKKQIRDSVSEPPIRGVRNGGMRLDEKVLRRKLCQARLEREQLTFQATEPFDKDKARDRRRSAIHARIAERVIRSSETWGLNGSDGNINKFCPEFVALRHESGQVRVISSKMMVVKTTLEDVLSIASHESTFPPERVDLPCGVTTEERARLFLERFSLKSASLLAKEIMVKKEKGEPISFGMMCLPCINPNPFITDREHLAVNVPTVIFLRRLEHIATGLENILGASVKLAIARELEHMARIFPMTKEQIVRGKDELGQVLAERSMTHINICSFESADTTDDEPRTEEVNKFLPAFKRSQFSPDIHPISSMLWLGIINEQSARVAIKKGSIDLTKEMEVARTLELTAFQQAKTWAKLRESPWQSTPGIRNSIITSVRPGSKNFTFIPVTANSSEQFPMLPQHCSVGINESGQLITMKRADFLIKPNRWIEALTEFGSIFIDKRLV